MTYDVTEAPERPDVQRGVQPIAASDAPSGELPAPDPELFERAREAVSALRGRGRQENGQAGPGNTLNLRHGLRSSQLLEQPDIEAWHREEVLAPLTVGGGNVSPCKIGTYAIIGTWRRSQTPFLV